LLGRELIKERSDVVKEGEEKGREPKRTRGYIEGGGSKGFWRGGICGEEAPANPKKETELEKRE